MNKYEKMWEHMKNALWKCYWEKNNKTARWSDILYIMNRVEVEINAREEAKTDSESGRGSKTMTNADKIIQLLQNPNGENSEEFNNMILNVFNCPLYILGDGLCKTAQEAELGICIECTKEWLYREAEK